LNEKKNGDAAPIVRGLGQQAAMMRIGRYLATRQVSDERRLFLPLDANLHGDSTAGALKLGR
jgi:hypothetical protein